MSSLLDPVSPRFPVGSTLVRRDLAHDRVWSASPHRVLRDDGQQIVTACWPGVELLASTTWIHWLLTGDDDTRQQAIPNLAAGIWELGPWTWRTTTLLTQLRDGDYFSVHRYLDQQGHADGWYVNFELPYRRTPIGIDTLDLLLDLVIDADQTRYRWKDENEYAHARRLGLITDEIHAHVKDAREQVIALLRAGEGPFAEDWTPWRADPAWDIPRLPADATTVSISDHRP